MMNEFPPGAYIAGAIQGLPPPGPDLPPQTVTIDARPLWGAFRVTFVVRRNPRRRMDNWFWTMETGERLELEE